MTGFAVEVSDLTLRYGRTTALDGVSVTLPAGGINGLLGRNGSGKTTFLSVLAAFRAPSGGRVLVDGEDPFENGRVMERTCLVREAGDLLVDERVGTNLRYQAAMRPTWDATRAHELADAFEIDLRVRVKALSRGKRSALGAVIGVASRAPLTLLDEVSLGVDAPTRRRFYDELLADVVAHPRTVVVSSHLIDELERLLETVVILDRGRALLVDDVDALRARGATLTGPAGAVTAATTGLHVLGVRDLGPTRQVTVLDDLDDDRLARLRRAGVDLGPVPLQELFIHLTNKEATR